MPGVTVPRVRVLPDPSWVPEPRAQQGVQGVDTGHWAGRAQHSQRDRVQTDERCPVFIKHLTQGFRGAAGLGLLSSPFN